MVAQMVKTLPTMWEIPVQILSQEDPREKRMATHSNILAWRIPWTEEPGGLQSVGSYSQTGLKRFTTHAHTLPLEKRFNFTFSMAQFDFQYLKMCILTNQLPILCNTK